MDARVCSVFGLASDFFPSSRSPNCCPFECRDRCEMDLCIEGCRICGENFHLTPLQTIPRRPLHEPTSLCGLWIFSRILALFCIASIPSIYLRPLSVERSIFLSATLSFDLFFDQRAFAAARAWLVVLAFAFPLPAFPPRLPIFAR